MPLKSVGGSARPTTAAPLGGESLKAQNWFAGSAGSGPTSSSRYLLRWLYPGHPGVCILGLAGLQDKTFRVGEEIEPGLKLKEVGKDYVLIEGQRGSERINLVERKEIPLSVPATPPVNRIEPDVENR